MKQKMYGRYFVIFILIILFIPSCCISSLLTMGFISEGSNTSETFTTEPDRTVTLDQLEDKNLVKDGESVFVEMSLDKDTVNAVYGDVVVENYSYLVSPVGHKNIVIYCEKYYDSNCHKILSEYYSSGHESIDRQLEDEVIQKKLYYGSIQDDDSKFYYSDLSYDIPSLAVQQFMEYNWNVTESDGNTRVFVLKYFNAGDNLPQEIRYIDYFYFDVIFIICLGSISLLSLITLLYYSYQTYKISSSKNADL